MKLQTIINYSGAGKLKMFRGKIKIFQGPNYHYKRGKGLNKKNLSGNCF